MNFKYKKYNHIREKMKKIRKLIVYKQNNAFYS